MTSAWGGGGNRGQYTTNRRATCSYTIRNDPRAIGASIGDLYFRTGRDPRRGRRCACPRAELNVSLSARYGSTNADHARGKFPRYDRVVVCAWLSDYLRRSTTTFVIQEAMFYSETGSGYSNTPLVTSTRRRRKSLSEIRSTVFALQIVNLVNGSQEFPHALDDARRSCRDLNSALSIDERRGHARRRGLSSVLSRGASRSES